MVKPTNDWQAEKAAAARFGVLRVLIEAGATNDAFGEVMRRMPDKADGTAPVTIDPNQLLPASANSGPKAYWTYEGSLTTPACAEVVTWMLLREPLRVAQADIERFKTLYPASARPLQQRNRRFRLMSG